MPAAKGKNVADPKSGGAVAVFNSLGLPAKPGSRAQARGFDPDNCATKAYRFQPGRGGNPAGLTKAYFEARRLAKAAAPDMMQRLIDLAMYGEDERVASVCGVAVLERAGVRPIDHDSNEDNPQPTWDPGSLDPEEREQLKALLAKMVKK